MDFLIRYRKWTIGLLGLLTLGLTAGLFWLRIDFSFESFYPKDNEDFQYYLSYQYLFGEAQNYTYSMAIESPEGDLVDSIFLGQVDTFFQEIQHWEGLDTVLTPFDQVQIKRRGLGAKRTPYFQYQTSEVLAATRQRLAQDSTLTGLFITKDGRSLCGYAQISPDIFDLVQRDEMTHRLEDRLAAMGYPYVLSGIPAIRTAYVDTIAGELLLFMSLSIVLITVSLIVTYRNFWGVIIPQMAVIISLVCVLGFMGATGQEINLISNLLIPIMFVVGMSVVIHLTTKYLQEVRKGVDPMTAMRPTLREIGFAVFLTSTTTAIGFASLLVSKIDPIRDFGLYAAVGVMITYVISIIILPNALLYIPPQAYSRKTSIEILAFFDRMTDALFRLVYRRSRAVLVISMLIISSCALLIFQIPTNIHLLEDIGKQDPIRKSMEFFEQQANGLRPFELGITFTEPGLKATDLRAIQMVDTLQQHLQRKHGFEQVVSLPSVVRRLNLFRNYNRPQHNRLPATQTEVDELLGFLATQGEGEFLNLVMSEDEKITRLSTTLPDMGSEAYSRLTADLDSFIVATCDTSAFSYQLTGQAHLTEQNLAYVRRSLLGGLSIAFVVVGLMMGLLFRSARMLIISMIPNVVPLVLTGGVMGIFGITLTASTALVFVIAFGIAVDDTIHF